MQPIIWESFITALQIHCVDWLAGSFSRTSCFLITGDHTDLYTWSLSATLSISWCTVSIKSATRALPVTIRIHHPKNFNSKLQVINTGLVWSPVLFSGQGEKLLKEINAWAIIWGNMACVYIYTHIYVYICMCVYMLNKHIYTCVYIYIIVKSLPPVLYGK